MSLKQVLNFAASLRLTVVCLLLALLLVFFGTLAQVNQGLYMVQERYFKSLLVWWAPPGADWGIPIFPGGYLIGGVLLVNLIAGHFKRFGLSRKKFGILLIHAGLILLLLGQLLTDMLSVESSMRLTEGTARSFSEDFHHSELVLVDQTDPKNERVTAIPEKLLVDRKEFPIAGTPVTLRVKQFWRNTDLFDKPVTNSVPTGANRDIGERIYLIPKSATTRMDERNLPGVLVEVATAEGSVGTWFVASQLAKAQTFDFGGKRYEIGMRFLRYYKPFALHLVDFKHDKYAGTEIPKNFSSLVRLENATSGENREVLIKMNHPLRYKGETFYQGSYDPNDERVSILQVVRNPSWVTPYVSCTLVGVGLTLQFMMHLIGFVKRKMA